MTTLKNAILTAIHFKGVSEARKNSSQLADDFMCSKSYVLNIVRQVEKQAIVIQST